MSDLAPAALLLYVLGIAGLAVACTYVRKGVKEQVNRLLPPDEQFQGLLYWNIFTELRMWRAHQRLFPGSSLRWRYAILYAATIAWVFFGLRFLNRWFGG